MDEGDIMLDGVGVPSLMHHKPPDGQGLLRSAVYPPVVFPNYHPIPSRLVRHSILIGYTVSCCDDPLGCYDTATTNMAAKVTQAHLPWPAVWQSSFSSHYPVLTRSATDMELSNQWRWHICNATRGTARIYTSILFLVFLSLFFLLFFQITFRCIFWHSTKLQIESGSRDGSICVEQNRDLVAGSVLVLWSVIPTEESVSGSERMG